MEARRLMLSESAALAAERRSDDQAQRLAELAARLGDAPDPQAAQALDFAFFSELVEAAGNVVLVLVMNSIRRIYFERAELFAAVVADPALLAPVYARAAQAVDERDPDAAASAVRELAAAQERAIAEALG